MATNSNIEWTDHTFNPWRGCTKVSPGCANCYASCNMSVKLHGIKWGPRGERVVKAESGWREPLKWNAAAQAAGRRARVFCASLADVFETADTMPAASVPVVAAARLRLLRLIYDTPHLHWLLLTKRPENIEQALYEAWTSAIGRPEPVQLGRKRELVVPCPAGADFCQWLGAWVGGAPPANVWLGTSVENQEAADQRIPYLLAAPAAVRFLSCEPLLGPVDLSEYLLSEWSENHGGLSGDFTSTPINWVIVGGESGPKARPMHPDWARSLRDQCQAAGVAFFFKQWGCWAEYIANGDLPPNCHYIGPDGTVRPGEDWQENDIVMGRVDKHAAGRHLDGRTWDEMPQGKEVAQ